MAISIENLVGRRIKYCKKGNRMDWEGTITNLRPDNTMPGGYEITVQYDNGVTQVYCIEALEHFGHPYRFHDAAGYLKFINERSTKESWYHYVILDAANRKVVGSADELNDVDRIAKNYIDTIGRKVVVYKSIMTQERDTPPIKTINLDI